VAIRSGWRTAYRAGRPPVTRLSWFDRSGNALGTLGSPEQSGLSTFTLSPDGRRVAAERTIQSQTDLWLLDSTRQIRFTHEAGANIARLPVWSRDGGRLAFASVGASSVRLSMKGNVIGRGHQYDVDGDGRFLINVDAEPSAPPITLVLDWKP
jgi:hypothetical protein